MPLFNGSVFLAVTLPYIFAEATDIPSQTDTLIAILNIVPIVVGILALFAAVLQLQEQWRVRP